MSQSANSFSSSVKRIGIVAGEASGDLLGAALIIQLKQHFPNAEFIGVGGKNMIAQGFSSLWPMSTLSVMGFIEPLKNLPQLLSIKQGLLKVFTDKRPDVFIGIDSPDFNLRIEQPLKELGIPTVHYVSPSVWAWRQGRVKKIAKAADLVLCLLPFEAQFYKEHSVQATFVGHPMADEIPVINLKQVTNETSQLLIEKGLKPQQPYIALLPGSRQSEVKRLAPLFFDVANKMHQTHSHIQFVVPAATPEIAEILTALSLDKPYITVVVGHSRAILSFAKATLVASGTATLEAMLCNCPMLVAYQVDFMTYCLVKPLIKTKYISLVNILAGKELVKERIQREASTTQLTHDLSYIIDNLSEQSRQKKAFHQMHIQLRQSASEKAAEAISELIDS